MSDDLGLPDYDKKVINKRKNFGAVRLGNPNPIVADIEINIAKSRKKLIKLLPKRLVKQ